MWPAWRDVSKKACGHEATHAKTATSQRDSHDRCWENIVPIMRPDRVCRGNCVWLCSCFGLFDGRVKTALAIPLRKARSTTFHLLQLFFPDDFKNTCGFHGTSNTLWLWSTAFKVVQSAKTLKPETSALRFGSSLFSQAKPCKTGNISGSMTSWGYSMGWKKASLVLRNPIN